MLKVDTKELLNVMNKLEKFSNKILAESYDTYKFVIDGNSLKISVYNSKDLKLSASVKMIESDSKFESFIISRKNLFKVLNSFKSIIYIEGVFDKNILTDIVFTDGKKKLQVKNYIFNKEKYQDLNIVFNKRIKVDNMFTSEIFKHIKYASRKETRPVLQAICLKENKIVTTDSYRLCKTELDVNYFDLELKIPYWIVEMIKKMKEEIIYISYESNYDCKWVALRTNDILIEARLIDGFYPDTSRLFFIESNYSTVIKSKELNEAIKTMLSISKNEEKDVCMNFNTNSLIKKLENDAIFEIDFESDKQFDAEIRYSLNYMKEALEHLKGDLTFEIINDKKPFIIRDGSKTLSLILPIIKL